MAKTPKKKVVIYLDEEDLDAIENAFFTEQKEVNPRLRLIWKKLCKKMGD